MTQRVNIALTLKEGGRGKEREREKKGERGREGEVGEKEGGI